MLSYCKLNFDVITSQCSEIHKNHGGLLQRVSEQHPREFLALVLRVCFVRVGQLREEIAGAVMLEVHELHFVSLILYF